MSRKCSQKLARQRLTRQRLTHFQVCSTHKMCQSLANRRNIIFYGFSVTANFSEPGSLSSVAEFHLFRIMQFVTHHVHHGLFAFTENTDGDDLYRCHTLKCMIPDAG